MLNKLEKALGYKFRDPELLRMALTHTSCANEIYQDPLRSYERLEFLGDSIVGFVTAEYLYRTFPKKLEGDLTRIRAELVCEKSLAAVAERLSLGEHLLLGNGEDQSGGRRRPSILCDVMEAVVAASYLDGGFAVASDIVTRLILPQLAEAEKTHDYKTELQELVQRKKSQQLSYELISETGPDHCKEFNVRVLLNGREVGTGSGTSKKRAEQAAGGAGHCAALPGTEIKRLDHRRQPMVPILFYSVRSRVERRMALASSVMHSSVATRNTAGMTMIHHASVSRAFSDRESMLPHETTSIGGRCRGSSASIPP